MLIKDKTAEIKTQWQRADRPARHGTQAGGRTLKGIAIGHKENSGPIFRYIYANTQIGGTVAGKGFEEQQCEMEIRIYASSDVSCRR